MLVATRDGSVDVDTDSDAFVDTDNGVDSDVFIDGDGDVFGVGVERESGSALARMGNAF